MIDIDGKLSPVSTHSRPKAAGQVFHGFWTYRQGFNTQPPEGGWWYKPLVSELAGVFQHTAARRRLVKLGTSISPSALFQHTAARRRLGLCHIYRSAI